MLLFAVNHLLIPLCSSPLQRSAVLRHLVEKYGTTAAIGTTPRTTTLVNPVPGIEPSDFALHGI